MQRARNPLITIVKLDNYINDDYCQELLKDEYYNTFDTYLVNETGKLEEIIRNTSKTFFCFISFTEFCNNKFYYTHEKQINKLFIPIKDKEMYEIFTESDYPKNVFSHYDPEIIYKLFIAEKQKLKERCNGFEGRINKKKSLIL